MAVGGSGASLVALLWWTVAISGALAACSGGGAPSDAGRDHAAEAARSDRGTAVPDDAADAPADNPVEALADLDADLDGDAAIEAPIGAGVMCKAPPDAGPDADASSSDARTADALVDAPAAEAADRPPPVCGNSLVEQGEDCDPPRPYQRGVDTNSYCGPGCRRILICAECEAGASSCLSFTGAEKAACEALSDCEANRCLYVPPLGDLSMSMIDARRCYCGTASAAACVAGAALGACRTEFEVAAGTIDPAQILASLSDGKTPVGAAAAGAYRIGTYCTGTVAYSNGPCFIGRVVASSSRCSACVPPGPTPVGMEPACGTWSKDYAWTLEPITVGYDTSFWSAGPNDTWMVNAPGLQHWDGTSWKPGSPPWAYPTESSLPDGTSTVLPFAGTPPGDLWFANQREPISVSNNPTGVGVGAEVVTWRFDGTGWSAPLGKLVARLWVTGRNDAVAVVSGNTFYHWDGTSWRPLTRTPSASVNPTEAWAASRDDIWVSTYGRFYSADRALWHWNGSTWCQVAVDPRLESLVVSAFWGTSSRDVWVLGNPAADGQTAPPAEIWHFDGAAWTLSTTLPWRLVDGSSISGLTGRSPTDVWAWSSTDGRVAHFDGTRWSFEDTGAAGIRRMSVEGAGGVWALDGGRLRLFRRHRLCEDGDGGAPPRTITSISAPNPLRDLVAVAPTELWGVAQDSEAWHWKDATWKKEAPFAANPGESLIGNIAGWGPNDVWVAGIHVMRWDGTAWKDMTPPGNTSNYSHKVWGRAPNDVWVERSTLSMFHWDGTAWSQPMDFGKNVLVQRLAAGSATDAWALGIDPWLGRTEMWHWDGSAWTAKPTGNLARASFHGSFVLSTTDIWALIQEGSTKMIHYEGGAWNVAATAPDQLGYGGVWASSPTDVWATPPHGDLWHYDGTSWSTVPVGAESFTSISGTAAGDVWAAGVRSRGQGEFAVYHLAPR